ncbi:MAG: acyl-CoA thioesterase II [Pseudomonadota bacterium]
MSDPVEHLLALLELERLDENLFRGTGAGGETKHRIFGGQVVGQALVAAGNTVADDRPAHSLHAYFMRPGDPSQPIIYEVDRARDGGSFTTRRVVAIQAGRQILNLSTSFHVQEPGFEHAHTAPQVPRPESLAGREALKAALAEQSAPQRRADILRPSAIEVRPVDPVDYTAPAPASDRHAAWFRLARDPGPVAAQLDQAALTYASDMMLLWSALRPHGESGYSGRVMTASLDHAVWFHAATQFANWHLYVMESPWAGGARALTRGQIFDAAGTLVASVAQEGLVRPITR